MLSHMAAQRLLNRYMVQESVIHACMPLDRTLPAPNIVYRGGGGPVGGA